MRRLRDPLLRLAYRVGFRVLWVYWQLARPTKRGVKCLLTREGEILLVRHTYGDGSRWDVPGGGVKRSEEPGDAATREMREELGIDVADWTYLGELFERIEGRTDQLWCFASDIGDRPLELDRAEIAEVGWFRRDRLPDRTARYVIRIASLAA